MDGMKWNHLAAATIIVCGLLIYSGAPALNVIAGAAIVWAVKLILHTRKTESRRGG
jgi:hypothetical protein